MSFSCKIVNFLRISCKILSPERRYEFWVTARTSIGEGSPSTKATLTPSSRVPAKIASFDETFTIPAKRTVKLPCIAVGSPRHGAIFSREIFFARLFTP